MINYDKLQYLEFTEADVVVDKGSIVFRLKSGMEVRVQANMLGDGIKRLVSFFKDLKNLMSKHEGGRDDPLESYMVDNLLEKHGIELEGV